MTDNDVSFPPALFAKQAAELSEGATSAQLEWLKQLSGTWAGAQDGQFGMPVGLGTATFKTRVQSNGRISIPDAEREALDIKEGDIVQTVVIPVKRKRED